MGYARYKARYKNRKVFLTLRGIFQALAILLIIGPYYYLYEQWQLIKSGLGVVPSPKKIEQGERKRVTMELEKVYYEVLKNGKATHTRDSLDTQVIKLLKKDTSLQIDVNGKNLTISERTCIR